MWKRPALQNKQVGVLRMAFRARKDSGTFEKRAPGPIRSPSLQKLWVVLNKFNFVSLVFVRQTKEKARIFEKRAPGPITLQKPWVVFNKFNFVSLVFVR